MSSGHPFRLVALALIVLTIVLLTGRLAAIPGGSIAAATEAAGSDRIVVLDDFENGQVRSGSDGIIPIGYVTWSDGSPVSITPEKVDAGSALALPEQTSSDTILRLDTTIKSSGWGGFTHAFANETFDRWISQDWSSYEGIALWLSGNGTGGSLFVDILENRNGNSKSDDAERWTYTIPDDFKGWKHLKLPFNDFKRKDIGNKAPNDGLSLETVYGYAVGAFGSKEMGQQSNYVDQVALYGLVTEEQRPVEIRFDRDTAQAVKGAVATFRVLLNKKASKPITVDYYALDGTAAQGKDFVLSGRTLTFGPGEMQQQFIVNILDDEKPTGPRRAIMVLANPQGAKLGAGYRSMLLIRDPYRADPNLLASVDTLPPFNTTPDVNLSIVTSTPQGSLALPKQTADENLLKVTYGKSQNAGYLDAGFAEAQDWSSKQGLSFWYYGGKTGAILTVQIRTDKTIDYQAPVQNWPLMWHDEFDGPAGAPPDPRFWRAELADGLLNNNPGWGNGELEYYTANQDNVAMDGSGNLLITARKIDPSASKLRCWYGPCDYTSSRLITLGKAEFTYGRVEARIKMPRGQGLWPAFWMLGANIASVPWPQSGEIDIAENVGREPAAVFGTIHGPGYSGTKGIGQRHDLASGRVSDDYHSYAVEWQPDTIRWYIDGINYFTATTKDIPAGSKWVYDHPFFLILNLAVGGNWPGNPDPTTTFPQTLAVDYVRVYQNPVDYQRFASTFKDDFIGWRQITLPFSGFVATQAGRPLNRSAIWGYSLVMPVNQSGTFYLDKLRLEP